MEKKLISESLNIEDLGSIRSNILVRNNTSGTVIVDKSEVKFLELGENRIVLKMPKHSCREKHLLNLFIFVKPLKRKVTRIPVSGGLRGSFEVIGRVDKIVDFDGNEYCSVEMELKQYDIESWIKFIGKYVKVQVKIDDLIRKKRT